MEATPSPEPEPEPTATPLPVPEPGESQPLYVHERVVKLRLDEGPVARGRVRTPDGYDSCRAHVLVKIFRNGEVVERLETRADGRFRVKLSEDRGRYVALAPQIVVGDSDLCERARSKTRKP